VNETWGHVGAGFTRQSSGLTGTSAPQRLLRDSGESAGAPMASTRYLPSGPECQSSPRASLSHAKAIAGRGEALAPKFRTIQACPKDPLTLPLASWTMRQTD
jgi:hypothetical protein